MFDFIDMSEPDDDNEAVSVSGWVTETLGQIPEKGDSFDYENMKVTVTKCDEKHVEEIIVEIERDKEDV